MFDFLKRKPRLFSAEEAARTMFVVAAHESAELPKLWQRTLSEEDRYALFLEYLVFLLLGIDRLAFATYGDPRRIEVMREVRRHLKQKLASVAAAEAAAVNTDFESTRHRR